MGSKSQTSKTSLLTKIKKEIPDFEMKDYAESAMKEMLGWYGYDRGGGSSSDTSSDMEGHVSGNSVPPRKSGSPQPYVNVPAGCMCCAWCQKVGNAKQFNFKTPSGNKVFCSEQCFTQCRRANFKRNKTCDWCRHVRHTVNYVDFQDGDHQLQFCSDKCLNQYKMNIFCKETQAHLELHPHLQESSGVASSEKGTNNLITPDLWLRDCRSQSPDTDRSTSPQARIPSPLVEIKMSPSSSPSQSGEPKEKKPKEIPKKRNGTKRTKINGVSEQRASSLSPQSTGSASPPRFQPHMPLLHPMPPPPFLPDQHRQLFFPPGFLPPPHFFHDLRFPSQSLPQRKIHANAHNNIPPLLPITRPMQPPPLLPMLRPNSIVPPPTTIVPYPIFFPIPIPIPIPIPLPGLRPTDLSTNNERTSPPPSSSEEFNNNNLTAENLSMNNNPSKSTQPITPPRKRKRIVEMTPEKEPLRKPKTVHA